MLRTLLFFLGTASLALAHTVTGRDADFVRNSTGTHIAPFMYLGAKHMVTGYDHLLFLLGVIFFLYKLKDVAVYVTCFAIGHSITLLAGVLGGAYAAEGHHEEAERELLDAHAGLVALGDRIPAQERPTIGQTVERLVVLYRTLGNAERAAFWASQQPPSR